MQTCTSLLLYAFVNSSSDCDVHSSLHFLHTQARSPLHMLASQANIIMGLDAGEVFTQRNVGNQVRARLTAPATQSHQSQHSKHA